MKIFITYSRSSKPHVSVLVNDLSQLGHQVWFDNELSGGQSWWDNILQNIRDCEIYVFALSREALDSTACRRELDYAKALQKSAIPVLLEKNISIAVTPRYLSNVQYVDYSDITDKNAVFALLKAINNLPPSPLPPNPLPVPPPVPISYLDNIKDKIDSPQLDNKDQIALVNELKNKLEDPENERQDIYDLLRRLKKRDDLLASAYLEINNILSTAENKVQEPTHVQRNPPTNPSPPQQKTVPQQTTFPKTPLQTTQQVPKPGSGWSTGLMVVLGICSIYPPVGILAGIIGFFTGATRKRSFLLIGISVVSLILGLLITLISGYSYYDYY